MAKLTATAVKALVAKGKPGAHADGGNLYLRTVSPGSAKWTLRYMLAGKAREMGLGAFDPDGKAGVTLAQARVKAEEVRAVLRQGLDPLEERKAAAEAERQAKAVAEAATRTFRDVAEMHVGAHEAGWRNEKHRAQWRSTLKAYAFPVMGDVPVAAIGTDHVLRALQPIWTDKPETAARVRGRIEAVLSYATARSWRQGENPARWRGHLDHLLPRRSKVATVENHAALPWQQMATFMAVLRATSATAARALEFAILTACRSGEVLGTRWSEIDLEAAVWIVPANRMKAGREHRVPLSSATLAVLDQMAPLRPAKGDAYVFPGQVKGKPLSNMAMLMLLRRMNPDVEGELPHWRDGRSGSAITAHGFRSSFRDWCEEATSTPHAVSEAALAHTIGDKVEAAYRRGDLFQKRAALMQEWADFCGATPAGTLQTEPTKKRSQAHYGMSDVDAELAEGPKRPAGRPRIDRSDFGHGVSTMPDEWTVAACLEAEWKAKGKWGRGSLGDLARHLSDDRNGGKAASAITKMRADPRYAPFVQRQLSDLRRLERQQAERPIKRDPKLRLSLEAAYVAATKKFGMPEY